jgi:ribosomal protein S13
MMTLPGRNFARFILMNYIWFALIIRTGYQGVQFEMMLKEMRPRDIETIDELIANNYTIYTDLDWMVTFMEMDLILR